MGGRSLVSGGTDWSKYTPINDRIRINGDTSPSGNVRVLKQIDGGGFISECSLLCEVYGGGGTIKITIDGNVIVNDVMGAETTRLYGIINKDSYTQAATLPSLIWIGVSGSINTIGLSQGYSAPYNNNQKTLLIENPIFFNRSLLVEFISSTSSSKTLTFTMMGGFK